MGAVTVSPKSPHKQTQGKANEQRDHTNHPSNRANNDHEDIECEEGLGFLSCHYTKDESD